MKYINRWGLMRNTSFENLSTHSFDVAVITHALSLISTKRLNIPVNGEKLTVFALFHDAAETLTGDLPTPVKYHDEKIKNAYKLVEDAAIEKLLALLPDDLKDDYNAVFYPEISEYEKTIIKAADKISALIKCIEEEKCGNREFIKAKNTQLKSLQKLNCPSANIYLEEFLTSFEKTLDETTL